MVTERCPERVVGGVVGAKRNREESAGGAPTLEWRVLESGVLAVKTPLNVVTVQGTRSVWFEPRKKRLVCPHGWGQYHLGIWNGPRAAEFPKSQLGQRVNARVQPACARARSCAGRCWHPMREPQATTRRSWPPRARKSFAPAWSGRACRARWSRRRGVLHGQGRRRERAALPPRADHAHARRPQARERQRYAAGLIAAALLGHRIAGKAMGGAAGPEGPSASRAARRGLVRLVVMLHAARAARRARRGGAAACGCAPVFVKACVKVK